MTGSGIFLRSKAIGSIEISQKNQVHGNGYPHSPCINIPILITMQPRPENDKLVLTDLTCILWHENNQIGSMVAHNFLDGPYCYSKNDEPNTCGITFRFCLNSSLINFIEKQRHQGANHDFVGTMRFQARIAKFIQTYTHPELGDARILAPYLYTRVDDVSLRIPSSDWIKSVLNNIGLDHYRIVEIELPKGEDGFSKEVLSHLDTARQYYDAGDYHKCIGDCRYIREQVNKHFGAGKDLGKRLADKVAQELGLPDDSLQKKFLDQTWQGFTDLTNAEHHIAKRDRLLPTDAHTCLLLVTVLLEYINLAR